MRRPKKECSRACSQGFPQQCRTRLAVSRIVELFVRFQFCASWPPSSWKTVLDGCMRNLSADLIRLVGVEVKYDAFFGTSEASCAVTMSATCGVSVFHLAQAYLANEIQGHPGPSSSVAQYVGTLVNRGRPGWLSAPVVFDVTPTCRSD